jgi:hypothetical protein
MNVEIGSEAVRFPEKEYLNGFFVSVFVWIYVDVCIYVVSKAADEYCMT